MSAPVYTIEKQILEAPSSTLTGLNFKETNVTQYLGIQFADIPGRFRKPVLRELTGAIDATNFASYCIQPPRDFYPIPGYLRPWTTTPKARSEEDVLNINISVPPGTNADSKLPVMVFIHGGANAYAGNWAPMYDGHALAHRSAQRGTPTIIAVINYRLGPFGFLASSDIREYNKKYFNESGVGNYGLWDQHVGLQWVKRYIGYFGGDASKVTLFGQSAGSQATHAHMLKGEPLFSKCIMQSGLLPLCGIFSIEQYNVVYEKILLNLGIDSESLSQDERVEALINAEPHALSLANEKAHVIPVVTMAYTDDRDFFKGEDMLSWGDLTKPGQIPSWVTDVMIGDCTNECIIWNKAWNHFNKESFMPVLRSKCSPELYEIIVRNYGLDEEMDNHKMFLKIEQFTTDGMYVTPNYAFTNGNSEARAFHFDQPSEYDNEWKGFAHHSLDNVYIWGCLKHTLRHDAKKLSEFMSDKFLDFANGKETWEAFSLNGKYMVFGPNDEFGHLRDRNTDIIRRKRYDAWDEIISAGLLEEFGKVCEDINLLRSTVHGYISNNVSNIAF